MTIPYLQPRFTGYNVFAYYKRAMRVIAGAAKGHPLKVPKGTPTRPATELVRGAVFSALESMQADFSLVLDLFSGSGSMGIEALSRGARWVDFIDRDKRCCVIIRENLASTGFSHAARVYCLQVKRAIHLLDKEYSLVLMDPPYRSLEIDSTLLELAQTALVGPHTIVCSTHSSRRPLKLSYGALNLFKELKHGDSSAAFYSAGGLR